MKEQAGVARSNAARVLIADDDVAVCSLLQVVLSPIAHVTAVNDAEAALELLARGERYDVIISDFELPGIDGLEFVRRIRVSEYDARVPILMISGHGKLGVRDRARAEGADAFLDKPFTLAQLRATVGTLLDSSVRRAS